METIGLLKVVMLVDKNVITHNPLRMKLPSTPYKQKQAMKTLLWFGTCLLAGVSSSSFSKELTSTRDNCGVSASVLSEYF